jgi:membrane protease YdiL (CAAX protease family)
VLFGACAVLATGVAGAIIGPLAALLSRVVGEPVVSFTWTELAAGLIATTIALRVVDDAPWSDIGFGEGAWRPRIVVLGALLGTAVIATVALILVGGGYLHFQPVPDLFGIAGSRGSSPLAEWSTAAFRILLLLAPAALFEELVFRGYLWTVAEDARGPRVALWSTSILFGLVHVWNPGAGVRTTLLVILAGLSLGVLRQKTDSLPAAWMAHLTWNWIMAAVLHVPVSGLPMPMPGYRGVIEGPSWLTGGSWGPEGGIVAAMTMGGALLLAQFRGKQTTRTRMKA